MSAFYVRCIYANALETTFILEANNMSSLIGIHIARNIHVLDDQSKYVDERE